jgi:hypothetical protein
MKKLLILFFISFNLFSYDFKFDLSAGYARHQFEYNGFNVSPGIYISVFGKKGDTVEDISIGLTGDIIYLRDYIPNTHYNIFVGPGIRLDFHYAYIKLAGGYDMFKNEKYDAANNIAFKASIGALFEVYKDIRIGLNGSFKYSILTYDYNQDRSWVFSVGPIVSFNI